MVDSADEPPLSSRLHSWARTRLPTLPLSSSLNPPRPRSEDPVETSPEPRIDNRNNPSHHASHEASAAGPATSDHHVDESDTQRQDLPSVDKKRNGAQPATIGNTTTEAKAPVLNRFIRDVKRILFSSWVNWLLIFVPVGIILGVLVDWVHVDIVSPSVVFAINAVAIIPLASLLAYATESVAIKLGDAVGALLNVTFGNAVELIIFIIALAAKEVRVVQAAALGSILSNLLLILGMCFVSGGLRFREQLYNATVSQMSACLLCLSVLSLLLPTAFHASFSNTTTADHVVLKVSRGTSVVLLLVYILYLLFQLKSHAFMYQSTPQHLIDEESHPGVLADILNSSSSDNSTSSDSDSDSSSGSYTTAKRFRRALRRKRRKSTSSTKDNVSMPAFTRSPSVLTATGGSLEHATSPTSRDLEPVFSGDEADVDGEDRSAQRRSRAAAVHSRDFESNAQQDHLSEKSRRHHKRSKRTKRSKKNKEKQQDPEKENQPIVETQTKDSLSTANTLLPQVGFSADVEEIPTNGAAKRPFNIRNLSEAVRPAFSSTVFPHHQALGRSLAIPMRPLSQARPSPRGLRRTSSMPDILHPTTSNPRLPAMTILPMQNVAPSEVGTEVAIEQLVETQEHLSRTSAIILLLVTTGLVAICAEFLVGSIDYLIATSGVSQEFIGLIILPIVGNAAEHVTAVTVAAKNKMDLAINIALGSSIQIALFVTPLMVILGWIIKTDMSLYFSLFETVSLFASAFIVSFLMIDGRSNYLEGSLLIAAYVIIAVAAFFYPTCDLSSASGSLGALNAC
ncbi:hypothetical protein LTR10_016968 [Elasticomyces elasticus]|uniref:Sodium/calcium exchanger membrane region domain-containing protein n=1 Tax=Exophiala sideris TaxID=1016849 RepID=A0ABR0JEY7_9EURO|nr:hypothetical protein LTR10_016968 [Elasticomyces elasticus]KAK5025222.1 hypothetical protein LTS07_008073 [Exophiala sideris]KAK5029230.1 hypothetical protein LTR13_008767 [Exophiala sideris]KAK5063281.1 hypothetical protein LTR69_003987 [Exophiala sideris]KAK5178997.1 hypothetical protein LTR44_008486 [Eurotiomycetes sp. CCFEE 6388]